MTSYPFFSDYLGVLNAHGYDVSNILFNNFLTLYFYPKDKQIGFRKFKYVKRLFKCEKLKIDYKNPIKSICDLLDNNKYVEIILNCLCLPFVKTTKYEFHDWLIYGYDDENKHFLAAGYLTQPGQVFFKYHKITISYDDFAKALPAPDIKTGFENNIMYNHTFSLRQNFSVERINYLKIAFRLLNYIIPFPPVFYNISVYKRYEKYINKNIETLKWFDLRNIVTINDHKKIIYSFACEYLKNDPIVDEIKTKILAQSDLLLHCAIKYNLTHKKSILYDVLSIFKQLSQNEKNIFASLIKKILKQGR